MGRHPGYRSSLPLALSLLLSMPAVALAQGIKEPHAPVATAQRDLTAMRTAYAAAYNAKDTKALGAMFTADAILDNADGTRTVGAEGIRNQMEQGPSAWGTMDLTSNLLRIYGSTAVDEGIATTHAADGTTTRERYLVVLRHEVHGWRLAYAMNVTAK